MRRQAVRPAPDNVFAEALSLLSDPYEYEVMSKVDGGLNAGPQTDAFNSEAELILFGGQAGGGKALDINTPMATPDGWTTMGALADGDVIFGSDGKPCRILRAHDISVPDECYRLTFDHGEKINASSDHLWWTFNMNSPPLPPPLRGLWGQCFETRFIARTLKTHTGLPNHVIGLGTPRVCCIVKCEAISPLPMRCLTVDSEDHLFLAGESMIPTHNSRLLLMVARLKHRRSLLIRRSVPELRRDMLRQAYAMYGDPKHYNQKAFLWKFPDGVEVELGYCEADKDLLRYKGGEYDFIGLDEGSELTAHQAYYFLSRLRSTTPGLAQQMIVATNPGPWPRDPWGPWIDLGVPPGQILYRKKDDDHLWITTDANDEHAHSMTFFPARLDDNPFLGKEYRRRLNLLPEPHRSQLRDGDWNAGMTDEERQVIPSDWVRRAVLHWRKWRAANGPLPNTMTIAGCDVGRLHDHSVIAPRYGYLVPELLRFFTDDTMQVVGYINILLCQRGGGAIVDVDGIGAGVYNRLMELQLVNEIIPFQGGGTAISGSYTDVSGTLKFLNLRAAAWWHMREALDPSSGLTIGLPPDDRLFKGLTTPRWEPSSGGKIKIEDKHIIKARLGFSPDEADAVVMAFWADMQALTSTEGTSPYRFLDNLSNLGVDHNRPQLMGRMR